MRAIDFCTVCKGSIRPEDEGAALNVGTYNAKNGKLVLQVHAKSKLCFACARHAEQALEARWREEV